MYCASKSKDFTAPQRFIAYLGMRKVFQCEFKWTPLISIYKTAFLLFSCLYSNNINSYNTYVTRKLFQQKLLLKWSQLLNVALSIIWIAFCCCCSCCSYLSYIFLVFCVAKIGAFERKPPLSISNDFVFILCWLQYNIITT